MRVIAPEIRPPVVAGSMNSGGTLENKLKMILARKHRKVSVVLCIGIAFCMLPQGLANAQDFEAVEQRLGGAVEAGELTLEQASIMMEALKRSAGSHHANDREMDARKRRYMAVAEEIEVAVEAGKLSKEDAEAKLIALRKKMFGGTSGKQARGADRNDQEMQARELRYMALAEKIELAVEAGKLTKDEAERKLIILHKEMFGDAVKKKARSEKSDAADMDARKQRYMEFAKEIEAAVEAGKLSKEDAEEKLIGLRMKMFSDAGGKKAREEKSDDREMEARKRRYEEAAKRIKAAVKKGELSSEEGEKKLIEVRKDMFGDSE